MNYSYQILIKFRKSLFFLILSFSFIFVSCTQEVPKILTDSKTIKENYLPDFSYAGYHNAEKELPTSNGRVILATDFGVIANDSLDNSESLINAIKSVQNINEDVILQLPEGRIIITEIIYIERSNIIIRGSGNKETEIYFPKPLSDVEDPEDLTELREYLIKFDKREYVKSIDKKLPYSQYSWSGGFIWTRVPGERVKPYLKEYQKPYQVKANVNSGKRGENYFEVADANHLKKGDVLLLQLFNKDGEKGEIITELYKNAKVRIGSHHWTTPDLPLVRQQVEIAGIEKNKVTIKTPLTININPSYKAQLIEWKHLEEVGIENLKLTFPKRAQTAHHIEPGFNGVFLTRVFNSWVKDIEIENADTGILGEEIANITVKNITTKGNNKAHYTVAMAGVTNVLAENIKVYNKSFHSLSFNTFSTKNVYKNCEVFTDPLLDQHSGANHQNLFDNIKLHIHPNKDHTYPLFSGGGAKYWKPSHGAYSTFWNININFLDNLQSEKSILLNGMTEGPFARLIGFYGNRKIDLSYEPNPYTEFINKKLTTIPSLYEYQLSKRLNK